MKLELADNIRPLVDSQSGLEVPVDWATKEAAQDRYLNRGFGNSYDFGQLD
jgi:hypothetical protein